MTGRFPPKSPIRFTEMRTQRLLTVYLLLHIIVFIVYKNIYLKSEAGGIYRQNRCGTILHNSGKNTAMLRIFHTADLHLGMSFTRGYAKAVQEALAEARFKCLRRMVDLANENDCNLFVVAGDLFHNRGVAKKDIGRVTRTLGDFNGGVVAVMPGNHDYIRPQDDMLWDVFKTKSEEGTLVLDSCRIFDLSGFGISAELYACPCTAKHSAENATGWIRPDSKKEQGAMRVGVAHGSMKGLSPDFDEQYFPMTTKSLLSKRLDIWLLGHSHIAYPATSEGKNESIFLPSTPEPDGFDCQHSGSAWIISVDKKKQVSYQRIPTGHYRFHTIETSLKNPSDIRKLEKCCDSFTGRDIVKLVLSGRLPNAGHDELEEFVDRLKERVAHLETSRTELRRAITLEDLDNEYTQDSFPHRFLCDLAKHDPDGLALQIAYDLIREVAK